MRIILRFVRAWVADQGGLVCDPDPASLRAALDRDEAEREAQSAIVRRAAPGWRVHRAPSGVIKFCVPGGSEGARRATTGGSGWSSSRVKALLMSSEARHSAVSVPSGQRDDCPTSHYAAVGIIPVCRA